MKAKIMPIFVYREPAQWLVHSRQVCAKWINAVLIHAGHCTRIITRYLTYFHPHPKARRRELDKETEHQRSKVTASGHQIIREIQFCQSNVLATVPLSKTQVHSLTWWGPYIDSLIEIILECFYHRFHFFIHFFQVDDILNQGSVKIHSSLGLSFPFG